MATPRKFSKRDEATSSVLGRQSGGGFDQTPGVDPSPFDDSYTTQSNLLSFYWTLPHTHKHGSLYSSLLFNQATTKLFIFFCLIKMNKKNVFAKSMRCITIIIIGKVDKFNEITICYFGQQRITWSIWVAHFTTIKHHVVHFPTPRAHIWTKNLKRNKLLPVSHETNLNNKLTILINAWNLPQELDIGKKTFFRIRNCNNLKNNLDLERIKHSLYFLSPFF